MNELVQQQTEVHRISRDPLDEVKVGDWYWIKQEDKKWDDEIGEYIKTGEHEDLMCVEDIGSNHVKFTKSNNHGCEYIKVHFNEFFARCRPELKWKEYLQSEANRIQLAIQEKTKELIEAGKSLYLLPQDTHTEPSDAEGSLLPVKVADEPKKYKKALMKLKDKTLPEISEEIEELAKDFATVSKDMALPEMVRLHHVRHKLGIVEDKIFTIELYCGLQEDVEQIADGEPAPMMEKIAIRQQMLYMDEETLFDYRKGGMDFKRLRDFDNWVCKPENMNRILPEQKGIVAFRVRRSGKYYPEAKTLSGAYTQISWHEANKQTYILIRNGQRVYRIASSIDFSPRLIPCRGEIGEEQFKKIHEKYVYADEKEEKKGFPFGNQKRIITEEIVTPDHIEYDEHVEDLDKILKQYNRIVILIQGLLDRSKVFHPHPPINLTKVGQMDEWVRLIRDEEDGLPCNKVTWEEYREQLNKTLRVGKYVYIKYPEIYQKRYSGSCYYDQEEKREVTLPRRGYHDAAMPNICKIDSMKRDGSAVRVSWPKGQLSRPKEGPWIPNPNRPGWGHRELIWETDRMLHEWVPTKYVFNVSDYTIGDFKMFLCDHALKGKYLEWAPFLLSAEAWQQRRVDVEGKKEDLKDMEED